MPFWKYVKKKCRKHLLRGFLKLCQNKKWEIVSINTELLLKLPIYIFFQTSRLFSDYKKITDHIPYAVKLLLYCSCGNNKLANSMLLLCDPAINLEAFWEPLPATHSSFCYSLLTVQPLGVSWSCPQFLIALNYCWTKTRLEITAFISFAWEPFQ